MLVWLIRDLDPLPLDGPDRRLMRSGMLAQALVRRGHRVRWFTSAFDHYRKVMRAEVGPIEVEPGMIVDVLAGRGYRRNISLSRIAHNRAFARDFVRVAEAQSERPDIVLADLPTTESADAAVRIAASFHVPSVVSIRDIWPDFFLQQLTPVVRPLARPAVAFLEAQARRACRGATALVGVSEDYLQWGLAKAGRTRRAEDAVFELGYAPVATTPEIAATLRERLNLPEYAALVSYVGSWGASYDIEAIGRIAARLEARTDIHFVVAGDPAARPKLAQELRRLPNVTLTGWMGAGDIAALLEQSRVGLLPYTDKAPQGLPNKVFEYMAYGTFQLATLGGEMAAFMAETGAGMALPGASADQLATTIAALVDDPSTEAGRSQRRGSFAERYGADAIYSAFAAHLEALVAGQLHR